MADTTLNIGTLRRGVASGLGIDIDISPSPVILVAELNGIARDLEDFEEPLTKSVKNVMMPSIRTNFRVQGRPSWAPLSQATLNRRRFMGRGVTNRILSVSTRLLRRATSFKIWTINGKAGEAYIGDIGGDVWYGRLHQEGFEGSGDAVGYIVRNGRRLSPSMALQPRESDTIEEGYAGDIPARPFLLIQPEDVDKIEDLFDEWVGETFSKHHWGSGR